MSTQQKPPSTPTKPSSQQQASGDPARPREMSFEELKQVARSGAKGWKLKSVQLDGKPFFSEPAPDSGSSPSKG